MPATRGDVWKHFILVEVAEHLLFRDRSLVYAESHVGRPEYALGAPGEWEKGIGRLWRHLPPLRDFLYFRILADLNPQGLRLYPGSSSLVLDTAKRCEALVFSFQNNIAIFITLYYHLILCRL